MVLSQEFKRRSEKLDMHSHLNFKCVVILFFFAFLCFPSLMFAWKGKVTEMINGNTFRVVSEKNEIKKVRLFGINAPKADSLYEEKAIRLIDDIASSDGLFLLPYKNGRPKGTGVIAYTLNDDTCINEKLILHGLATIDNTHCDKPICNTWELMEQQAKQKKLGIWSSCSKSPEPALPYRWNRGRKQRLEKSKNSISEQIYIVDRARAFLWREQIILPNE